MRHIPCIIGGEKMYIVQIADLHIGSKNKPSTSEENIIKASIYKIQTLVPKNEIILLCICGDIIDSQGLTPDDSATIIDRLNLAASYLKMYRSELEGDYTVKIHMCVGNHDITHLDELEESTSFLGENFTKDALRGGYVHFEETENTYFIFLNSCYRDQYSVGQIDYDSLEAMLETIPLNANKILVMHHTIMSMDDQDKSSIMNAAKLLGIIEKKNICGVLHGHIHGRDILTIGKNECKIIGTGALFSRDNADVNSQFNIIHYQKGFFSEIQNCRYIADAVGSDDCWDVLDIGQMRCHNYFTAASFKDVYDQLLNKLAAAPTLYNVVLHINSEYADFKTDLRSFLNYDTLTIGTKKFKYFDLAEMWERVSVPDELYFNHGQFFSVNGVHGIEDIADQLKNKPTSSRAILTTCDMKTIKLSLEDRKNELLPSLMSIQFSKDNTGNKLYVHMQLRALEASRFLKINICEIEYLLSRLAEKGIQFREVDITVSAFRVRKRERFNCFIKADIDGKMMAVNRAVFLGEIEKLCEMLQEKKDSTETITHSEGIENMYNAMIVNNSGTGGIYYTNNIIDIVKEILGSYNKLDKIHRSKSIPSDEETEYENKIDAELGELIQKLHELKNEDVKE